jgi:thiamine kinase-like enzyme
VDDIATVRRTAERFAIAAPVEEVLPLGAGLVNETYLVRTNVDEYVLQRINGSVFGDPEALMQNIATVSEHLSGRFVPQLVEARPGGWLVYEGAVAWRIWRRVADATPCAELTPARVRSAAELVGRFHLAVADLARRLALLRDAVDADPFGRVEHARPEIERVLAFEELATEATALAAQLSPQVAHNDAQMNNILFRGDEAVCLVDLDTVMPTARFWDVGDLLRSASTRGAEDDPDPRANAVDPELFRAIVGGYRDAVGPVVASGSVEDGAVELAGLLITYEQALRFLTDHLRGDVYYRTTRAGQNLDRTQAQLALLTSMRGTVGS